MSIDLKKGQKAVEKAGLISFLLTVGKGIVGFLSGSVVLVADALHNLTDLTIDIASWFGLKIAQRKPDEKFPYGYYKVESLTTLFVSLFILYAACELLIEGYSRLFIVSEIDIPFLAMLVALISSLVSISISKYLKNTGKSINSELLIVNSKERFVDGISSIFVFLAIFLNYYKIPCIEGITSMIISLLILKVGIFSIKDSVFSLMDISPSKEEEEKIKKIIKSVKGVDDFTDLKLRKSGPFIFGEVKIKVKRFIKVERGHEIADEIENKIKEKIKQVNSFTVHVEPYKTSKHRIAIPILKPLGLESKVMEHFGRANYFLFVDTIKNSITRYYSKENPCKKKEVRAGLEAAHFIIKEKVDVLITKEIGEISLHILRDKLIDVYKTKGETAKEVIDNFFENKLVRLKEPTREKN
ncbi:MAG: hypothetical protein DRP10_01525 [Candidatus Aenigmatarchaeota archaeon]|nr:MAG: hypothetical protein DRP10_01525 [Candidatus Aenigmarchaeota archaeon]